MKTVGDDLGDLRGVERLAQQDLHGVGVEVVRPAVRRSDDRDRTVRHRNGSNVVDDANRIDARQIEIDENDSVAAFGQHLQRVTTVGNAIGKDVPIEELLRQSPAEIVVRFSDENSMVVH
jgi:hypothetical protein